MRSGDRAARQTKRAALFGGQDEAARALREAQRRLDASDVESLAGLFQAMADAEELVGASVTVSRDSIGPGATRMTFDVERWDGDEHGIPCRDCRRGLGLGQIQRRRWRRGVTYLCSPGGCGGEAIPSDMIPEGRFVLEGAEGEPPLDARGIAETVLRFGPVEEILPASHFKDEHRREARVRVAECAYEAERALRARARGRVRSAVTALARARQRRRAAERALELYEAPFGPDRTGYRLRSELDAARDRVTEWEEEVESRREAEQGATERFEAAREALEDARGAVS